MEEKRKQIISKENISSEDVQKLRDEYQGRVEEYNQIVDQYKKHSQEN